MAAPVNYTTKTLRRRASPRSSVTGPEVALYAVGGPGRDH